VPDSSRHLTLLIPGLSGPESDPPLAGYLRPRPRELDRLLSRSRCETVAGRGLEATLCRVFGLDPDAALPVAALTWLADSDDPPPPHLLRADPVHLRADQRYLRLFETHSVPVRADEAAQLVASINEFNSARGWRLVAPHPHRWYLSLPSMPRLLTHAPQRAAGADIDPCLPAGTDARQWHGLLNELQMLLHDHPVNQARAARGEPAINSLWLWGNGDLPAGLTTSWPAVCADHPLARGLARCAGIDCRPVPAALEDWLDAEVPLVILDTLEWPQSYRDIEHWLDEFERLERDWLRPAARALRSGRLASLTLDVCNGRRFSGARWRQYRFWQPTRPFEAVCGA
jgi:hypothetical protein